MDHLQNELQQYSHRRYNPMLGEWIVVSPLRLARPWNGQTEQTVTAAAAGSGCSKSQSQSTHANYLQPGAMRSTGIYNDYYDSCYIFENDFPSLDSLDAQWLDAHLTDGIVITETDQCDINDGDPFFRVSAAKGKCQVICFHPDSSKTLATMSGSEVRSVVEAWIRVYSEQEQLQCFRWIQIFENRGAVMGCSNPHPHCQVWSCCFLPSDIERKDSNLRSYRIKHGPQSNFLFDYVQREMQCKVRIVQEWTYWIQLVPFWGMWPYETMLLPKGRIIQRLNDLHDSEVAELCVALPAVLRRYDNLMRCDFPYTMGWHGAPLCKTVNGGPMEVDYSHWQLHCLFLPPLLRSSAVKKYIAGFELTAERQRDLTPERAAEILRAVVSARHYSEEILDGAA